MYSTASVKVLPEPADALYIWRDVGVLVMIVGFYLYAKLRIRFYMTKCFGGYLVVCQRFLEVIWWCVKGFWMCETQRCG